jgi:hypothetical protein
LGQENLYKFKPMVISRIIPVILLFSLLLETAEAQNMKEGYYYFDNDWKPAKEKGAVYLLRAVALGDSCMQFKYYQLLGPLVRIETFRKGQPTVRQGFFAWYSLAGTADSAGYYENGLPDKLWLYVDAKGEISRSRIYEMGKLVQETNDAEERRKAREKDSARQIRQPDSKDAEFVGGSHGWLLYLNHHFRYPDRAVNNEIQGEIRTYFRVDSAGKISEPILIKSVEISMDEQCLSLITGSPDWIPATKDGRNVKSYKVQPFIFKLETGRGR